MQLMRVVRLVQIWQLLKSCHIYVSVRFCKVSIIYTCPFSMPLYKRVVPELPNLALGVRIFVVD